MELFVRLQGEKMTTGIIRVPGEIQEQKLASVAFDNVERIKKITNSLQRNLLDLGELFYENKINKYYRALGYDSWTEFLGDPDMGYKESSVRGFILIYKKYRLAFKQPKALLAEAGFSKLRIISPVVDSDESAEEWVQKASVLSRSDLITEVNEAQGKPEGAPRERGVAEDLVPQEVETLSHITYREWVSDQPCIFHDDRPSEFAHYPVTKKAGGVRNYQIGIPLCHECHMEHHHKPWEFFWTYKNNIMRWMFETFVLPQFKPPDCEHIKTISMNLDGHAGVWCAECGQKLEDGC